jgi:NAD(P)-dependent dehydrogenase (short-subunit alcohol dehydrogenase family)
MPVERSCSPDMNLERFCRDKVIVITGSSRGIGRETARLALAAGARVVLNGRDEAVLNATRRELGGGRAIASDVATPEGADALIRAALEAEGRIDVVIANAGTSMRGAFANLAPATVRTMVEANLLSAVWTAQAALPALRRSQGRLVFVSSLAAARGFPEVSLYSAAKMGLTAVHQALGAEEPEIKSCLVYLPFTENDAGKTILGADGVPFRHERRAACTQKEMAKAILNAAAKGRKKTVLTAAGRVLFWTQSIFPWVVDRLVSRSRGIIHSVRRSS